MPYGTRPFHLQHKSGASNRFPAQLRAWRKRENFSQSEAALRLKISKRTLQEWEQGRAVPHGLARSAVENVIRLMRSLRRSG
jgi:DNA-binding transcriptional regulator YiaG